MDRGILLLVGALLTGALVTGLLSYVKAGQARRLKERIAAAGTQVQVAAASDLPSIRLKTGENLPFVDRVLRFLRFNPDMPQEQVVPWPVVVVLGAVIGVVVAVGFLGERFAHRIDRGQFFSTTADRRALASCPRGQGDLAEESMGRPSSCSLSGRKLATIWRH